VVADPLRLTEQGDRAYARKDYVAAEAFYLDALSAAKQIGTPTNYIYTQLARVFKRNKAFKEAYALSRKAVPTPAGFTDCATSARGAIRQAISEKDMDLAARWLDELYRLGVRAWLCYGAHDCKSGVAGYLHERAVYIDSALESEAIGASYASNGRIGASGGLLVERDYSLMAKVFGVNALIYDPLVDFGSLVAAVDSKIRAEAPSLWRCISRYGTDVSESWSKIRR
jgi:hypothetical protein